MLLKIVVFSSFFVYVCFVYLLFVHCFSPVVQQWVRCVSHTFPLFFYQYFIVRMRAAFAPSLLRTPCPLCRIGSPLSFLSRLKQNQLASSHQEVFFCVAEFFFLCPLICVFSASRVNNHLYIYTRHHTFAHIE